MTRALLIAIALLSAGWFALGVRQANEISAATLIVSSAGHHLTPGQVRHARALLSSAAVLNPDSTVEVLRAQLDRDQGDLRGARRILNRVVAREPDNLAAWSALGLSAAGSRATALRALRNAVRLDPAVRVGG
jgi:predicted Zn-dependent protease